MMRLSRPLVVAIALASVFGARAEPDPSDEYIILSGGPSLSEWEQYRREGHRHDLWWGNFIRTARIRIEQLQQYHRGNINLTWLVYRQGYERRATEEGEPLITHIESVRDKYGVKLVWISSGGDVIDYLNNGMNRRKTKVGGFEYFGHSNKYCFTFDYSNEVLGASKAYLHQSDLKAIQRGVFSRDAYCKSWGCHSGESFVQAFRRAAGVKMIGAIGKTDYSESWRQILPFLSSPGGKWVD